MKIKISITDTGFFVHQYFWGFGFFFTFITLSLLDILGFLLILFLD